MPRKLPPLNPLKAFEAAARTGGYVSAARELGVSPAAVSQQVKTRERFFDKRLFTRHNNRLSLTDAGLYIFSDSAAVFERLAGMTEGMLEGGVRSRLVISAPSSLASRWLNRRLHKFLDAEPAMRLEIRVEDDPVDFARHNIDVRICYGRHLYPDLSNTVLIHDEVLPLCTPSMIEIGVADAAKPEILQDEHLIHTNWGPSFASHPTWADWFARIGADRVPDVGKGHSVGMSSLAVDLALAGAGIALGQRLLARDEISDGRLRAPFGQSIPLGHPYCAVHAHAKSQKPGVRSFVEWVTEVANPGIPSS